MFSLSEVVAAVAVSAVAASLQCAGGNLNMNMAFSLLTQQFYMRAAFLSAILIHEWMHLLSAVSAATLAAKPGAVTKTLSAIISPANLRANLSWGAVTQLLIPCLPLPPAFHPHIAIPAIGTRHRQLIYTSIEALGAVGSITAALFVTMSPAFGTPVVISFWICVALSLASDAHFFKPSPAAVKCDASKPSAGRWEAPVWTFFCGNFGLIVACSEGDSGMDIFGVLKAMARICMMRGAQSGGIGALMQHSAGDAKKSVYSFRSRFSAAKRDVLGIKLANMFKRDAFVAKTLKGASATPQNMDYGSFFGHTRFATSSIPLATETHPHQWTPAANIKCTHWSITPAGEWSCERVD